ncbi:MAG: hypothetical protein ABIG28_03000 [archaeon]
MFNEELLERAEREFTDTVMTADLREKRRLAEAKDMAKQNWLAMGGAESGAPLNDVVYGAVWDFANSPVTIHSAAGMYGGSAATSSKLDSLFVATGIAPEDPETIWPYAVARNQIGRMNFSEMAGKAKSLAANPNRIL